MPDRGRAGLDSLDLVVEGGVSDDLVAIADQQCPIEQSGVLERVDLGQVA